MSARRIRERVADTVAAAQLLCDTRTVVGLAVEAVATACPRGFALAFTRRADGSYGSGAARLDGAAVPRASLGGRASSPWVVDIDHVPGWQQNSWVEPMHAGVHGPDYFCASHPARRLFGPRSVPGYGRMMEAWGVRALTTAPRLPIHTRVRTARLPALSMP